MKKKLPAFLNDGKPELYAAGVSIRNSVRPSLRKKRKHVKSRMLKTPALFARDLPNCG
ncbi:hypothetical protein [Bacillus velezensis]|uniref:hypothetical protein n=1 Tax=Bacillus velezensis TaxID=492670 RepID=UPI001EF1009E|nr:hypothetical protein [Bacillus velezensis]ULH20227.1 hypothetical protein MF598_00490 [Bacillus velezensis]